MVFPAALSNYPIHGFPAKNDQIVKRKYHTYKYHFVAYLMFILNIYLFYKLGLIVKDI